MLCIEPVEHIELNSSFLLPPSSLPLQVYREEVYNIVKEVIASHPGLGNGPNMGTTVTSDDPLWGLFMGFEHDRIHLETSSVLFRETPIELVQVRRRRRGREGEGVFEYHVFTLS